MRRACDEEEAGCLKGRGIEKEKMTSMSADFERYKNLHAVRYRGKDFRERISLLLLFFL